MSSFPSSNSVSNSLEVCRQAFRKIVESQRPPVEEEEEDYLEKASRFEKEEPMDSDDVVFVDAENKEHDENLEKIVSAINLVGEKYAENGKNVIVADHYETFGDDGSHRYCYEFKCDDESCVEEFVSDLEKTLAGPYCFECGGVSDESGSHFICSITKCDQIGESVEFKPFEQEHKRLCKPKQIKKSAQFVRNNRLMKRLFRRKYFAKKKLLFGTK